MHSRKFSMSITISLAITVSAVILVGTVLNGAYSQSLTVKTDKPSYTTGDTINVTGNVGTVQSGQPVLIQVYNEKNSPARVDQVTPDANGTYTYSFKAGGPYFANSGTYSIKATYAGQSSTATFSFTSTAATVTWKNFDLKVGSKTYIIQYQISGAGNSVSGMTIDSKSATLSVAITSAANGNLIVRLPREVIEARSGQDNKTGTDTDFAVFADSLVSNTVDEIAHTNTVRTLSINFKQGTGTIEIVGTTAIPEFGFIAAIVLAMSIVGVIVATRYSGKFQGLSTG